MRPYLEKNLSQIRVGGVAQGVSPEFKPQYHQKKDREKMDVNEHTNVPYQEI
jgi:hypothetical protein